MSEKFNNFSKISAEGGSASGGEDQKEFVSGGENLPQEEKDKIVGEAKAQTDKKKQKSNRFSVREMYFDPKSEFELMRQMSKSERREGLKIFKEELGLRKKGLAQIENKLFEEVKSNPEISEYDLHSSVGELIDKYKLAPEQQNIINKAIEEYKKRHDTIREVTKDCIIENTGEVDGKKLFIKLFKKEPNGEVQVIISPFVIHFRLENSGDYTYVYHRDFLRPTKFLKNIGPGKRQRKEASKNYGTLLFLPSYPNLERAISAENISQEREESGEEFEKIDKEYNHPIFLHEERHAYNALLALAYGEELSYWGRIKDELLADLQMNSSPEEIKEDLLESELINKKNDYTTHILNEGVDAIFSLLKNGYSLKEAEALLYKESFEKWPKVVKRLIDAK